MMRRGGRVWRGTGDTSRTHDSDAQNHHPSSSGYSRGRGGQSGDGRRGGGRGGGGGSGDAVLWTDEDDERLRKSIKENRVDDWQTLGDWSEVRQIADGEYDITYGWTKIGLRLWRNQPYVKERAYCFCTKDHPFWDYNIEQNLRTTTAGGFWLFGHSLICLLSAYKVPYKTQKEEARRCLPFFWWPRGRRNRSVRNPAISADDNDNPHPSLVFSEPPWSIANFVFCNFLTWLSFPDHHSVYFPPSLLEYDLNNICEIEYYDDTSGGAWKSYYY